MSMIVMVGMPRLATRWRLLMMAIVDDRKTFVRGEKGGKFGMPELQQLVMNEECRNYRTMLYGEYPVG